VLPDFVKKNEGFPLTTLHRYHTFLEHRRVLECYDQVFYTDCDMLFVAPVGEEIFSDGVVVTEHPGYVNLNGTPEKRPESTAYCPVVRNYVCGGFNGGETGAFLKMAETIAANVDEDARRGITAIWHDESHLNFYVQNNPPTKILDPSYCYPESEYRMAGMGYYGAVWRQAGRDNIVPKLLALDKPR
jgi:histo-blood group ABO system transferase